MSPRSCTVFIGNVPYDAQEEELRGIFSRVGAVESLRLVYDKDTKQPKGYGFCDYSDPDTAMSAVRNLNEVECNGRHLRIDLADNALRSREAAQKAAGPGPPLPLPAPELQPRPALPPPSAAPLALPPAALPLPPGGPRPVGLAGAPALPPEPPADASAASPEAVIAAVSAHTEIAQTVAAMPQAQLQLCLGTMQRLAVEAPESARALLQDNPQLCYALLHAQLLLGLTLEPVPPPDAEEARRLRAEAARRPAAAPPAPGAVVVPPGAPGAPGGPPRPAPRGLGLGVLPLAPGPLPGLGAPRPPGPAGPAGPAGLAGLRPALAPGAGRAAGDPAPMGLAPKGWALRPPAPRPVAVAPRPGLAPAQPAMLG